MSLIANRELFEPADANELGQAWYGIGSYGTQTTFNRRVNDLQGRFAPNGQKLLIAGCGWGHLVALCRSAGYDAWGCDASSYCISKDVTGGFTRQADITSDTQIRAVAAAAGIPGGNPRFDLMVTEDVLSCLTLSEVNTAVGVLRGRSRSNLLHIITCLRPDWWPGADDAERRAKDLATRMPALTWLTLAEWQAILSPPDLVLDSQAI